MAASDAAEADLGLVEDANAVLVIVAGLPGCGKTSFCRELLARLDKGDDLGSGLASASWHHICYDKIEAELRGSNATFDPATWKAARERASDMVGKLLEGSKGAGIDGAPRRCVVLLDDNMYYRSMRKQWYHLARERQCAYRQIFLTAPMELCLSRNSSREPSQQVPDFSIRHMAEAFEWPRSAGSSWEALEPVTTTIDSSEESTAIQVENLLRRFAERQGSDRFWAPLPAESEENQEPDVQSSAHNCDLALRKIVSQALAQVPKDKGQVKSMLAKRWGTQKTELARQLAADLKDRESSADIVEDLIHEMEGVFLKSCAADIQEQLSTK
eukprot:TRINITY_DN54624_c0_g1_i1.p1 TRINITY_DN54624_c0_g1~~TRINITY_DN54624_c0_g1_i1.p1  ORF type:complete len:329 (-),score=62.96 TRINITY_DN54624_c0_g1_i1:48-1034(-)